MEYYECYAATYSRARAKFLRVASAAGEGSVAVTQMTQYLQEQTRNS